MKSALVFLAVFSFSALAFAQGAPADPSAPSALAQSGPAWQAAVLVFGLTLLPLLDKMFTAGEWPFGWALTVKYRFVVLAVIGGALTCLQAVQGGTSWGAAAITAALAVIGAIMKNGASLFGGIVPQMVPAPPATAAGSAAAKMASKRPPPMVPPLAMLCLALALSITGCAAFKRDTKTVLDALDIACILGAPIEASVPEIAQACQIAEALIPDLEKALAARKRGMAAHQAAAK